MFFVRARFGAISNKAPYPRFAGRKEIEREREREREKAVELIFIPRRMSAGSPFKRREMDVTKL